MYVSPSTGQVTDLQAGQDRQCRAIRLPAQPCAAALARRYVRQLLTEWGLAALADTAQLVASELVTNAVTAADQVPVGVPQVIEVSARRSHGSVIISVRDPSPEPPVRQHADPGAAAGRGLLIVSALAAGWGHGPADGGGKVVWCQLAPPGECDGASPGVSD